MSNKSSTGTPNRVRRVILYHDLCYFALDASLLFVSCQVFLQLARIVLCQVMCMCRIKVHFEPKDSAILA